MSSIRRKERPCWNSEQNRTLNFWPQTPATVLYCIYFTCCLSENVRADAARALNAMLYNFSTVSAAKAARKGALYEDAVEYSRNNCGLRSAPAGGAAHHRVWT